MLLALVSCGKMGPLFPRTPGSEIVFGSSLRHGASTKAAYSGVLNGDKYERIDWVDGDKIRIYCQQAVMPEDKTVDPALHWADYSIKTGTVASEGVSSSAKVSHISSSQYLTWGAPATKHWFSALCPAPGSTGAVSGTAVSEDKVTCVLPDVQEYSKIEGTVAKPNAAYMYLAGCGEAQSSEDKGGDAVNLYFDPAVTTFEFTLKNAYESGNSMTIASAGITVASGKLAGTYDVYVKDRIGVDITKTLKTTDISLSDEGSSETITMNFSPVVTVAKDAEFTFTLFAQPGNNISKLTFWMIDESGVKRSFAFKYADPDNPDGVEGWVNFIAFHKARITGLMAPESAGWIINMVPVVVDWIPDEQEIDADAGSVLTFSTAVEEWTEQDNGNILYSE